MMELTFESVMSPAAPLGFTMSKGEETQLSELGERMRVWAVEGADLGVPVGMDGVPEYLVAALTKEAMFSESFRSKA